MTGGEALQLGRYAAYVWPAYGISAVVLVAAVAQTLVRARRWRRAAEEDGRTARRDEAARS